uniref:Uncharacterized protein n=2 Tax=Avena sativa TaxID=4498 RepID=A0ACD6AK34_AVESA
MHALLQGPGEERTMADGSTLQPTVHEIRRSQRADGPAAILAIGTANPPNCVSQEEYPDLYFRVSKTQHLTELKQKFKAMCEMTTTEKRYFHHTEQVLNDHPDFLCRGKPSLDARLAIAAAAAPDLAASAAAKAIAKWGHPATDITHLVVSTNSGAHAPAIDLRLASLLGLSASVRRTMLHLNGCSAGAASLRLAKDMAENNRGARVLVVCVELTVVAFRGPQEAHTLIGQAGFGDGAGAVIVGAAAPDDERPLFEIVSVFCISICKNMSPHSEIREFREKNEISKKYSKISVKYECTRFESFERTF